MRARENEWATNLVSMLEKLETIKKLPSTHKGIHLHLGCGPQIFEGFINIDKYYKDKYVLQYDMFDLPFQENSVSTIYSSHALEHLPIKLANGALKKWYNILEPEGNLYLAIPDLEEIMSIMLDPNVNEDTKWHWYIYTLFGYQIKPGELQNDENTPIDPGQFHTCGYTKKRLQAMLESNGFKIHSMFNYDGWATPSIWVEAYKPK